jgi:hypothetical protein
MTIGTKGWSQDGGFIEGDTSIRFTAVNKTHGFILLFTPFYD